MSDPSLMELVRHLPTGSYWKRRPNSYPKHTKRKLKKDQLRDHLKGLYAIGLSPIRPGADKTCVALFDLDNHSDDDVPVRLTMQEIVAAAEEYNLYATVFTSSGGKGVHVYFIWDEPQDARSVRALLVQVLEDCLLLPGTGGLEKSQVEVFPKQDSVPEDGYGSMFILPYAFESEWLDGAWQASQSVPVVPPADTHDTEDVVEVDPELLQSAVHALPNADVDYDEWRNTVFAIHAASGGTDAGLQLAVDWSSKSDKHDEQFLRKRVWPYVKAGRGITARTLLAKAREAGWQDDVLAAFETVGEAAGVPDDVVAAESSGEITDEPSTPPETTPRLPAFVRDRQGRIEATVGNLQAALRAAMIGHAIGFDSFTQQMMLQHDDTWTIVDDNTAVDIRIQLEARGFKPISKEMLRDVLRKVAHENTFDSAQDWLYGLEWDGQPRVDSFLTDHMGAPQGAFATAVSRYWWTAMAGRVCEPGIQADMVPVLVGPQGTGKSTALARMVPARDHLVEIDLMARDADLSRIMQGALIGEIAELRGLHSREDEHIKAMITRTQEKWVPKYQEYPRIFDRRLVFVGTTNHGEFLSDHTGNRRWLPVRVGDIDRALIESNREQLWAEAHTLFEAGGIAYAKAERLAVFAHSEFEIEDAWEGLISAFLEQIESEFGPDDEMHLRTNDILVSSGAMSDAGRITRGHQMRLARIMNRFGWHSGRFYARQQDKNARQQDKKTLKQVRGWLKTSRSDDDELV